MLNTCQILLKQGKHAGKACCDSGLRCRHAGIVCSNCKRDFNRRSTYTNHIKICQRRPRIVKKPQLEDLLQEKSVHWNSSCQKHQ